MYTALTPKMVSMAARICGLFARRSTRNVYVLASSIRRQASGAEALGRRGVGPGLFSTRRRLRFERTPRYGREAHPCL